MMKNIKLAVLTLAALSFGRTHGFSTANAQSDDIAALKARADEQDALIAKQQAELDQLRAAAPAVLPPAEEPLGTLGLLAKGAGVPIEDVRWRVQLGLDPEQAVQAAVLQQQENERAAAAQKGGLR